MNCIYEFIETKNLKGAWLQKDMQRGDKFGCATLVRKSREMLQQEHLLLQNNHVKYQEGLKIS